MRKERSPINALIFHLQKSKKEEQNKPKTTSKKEEIMIKAQINEIDNRKTTEKNQ